MLKSTFMTIAVGLALSVVPSAQAANISVFTDRSLFEAEFSSIFVENFDDGALDPSISVLSDAGSIKNMQWDDRLVPDGAQTTFSFSSAAGFGGDWDLAGPRGLGTGIRATVFFAAGGSQVVATEIPSSYANQFWGIMSDTLITSVLLQAGTQGGGAESYVVDNLTIGSDIAPVPLPAALPLFALALAALGFAGSRRRIQPGAA